MARCQRLGKACQRIHLASSRTLARPLPAKIFRAARALPPNVANSAESHALKSIRAAYHSARVGTDKASFCPKTALLCILQRVSVALSVGKSPTSHVWPQASNPLRRFDATSDRSRDYLLRHVERDGQNRIPVESDRAG